MEFSINWNDLGLVFGASILFTSVITAAFATGVRMLTNVKHLMANNKKNKPAKLRKEIVMRSVAYLSFTLFGVSIVYGIYLIVPYFHLDK